MVDSQEQRGSNNSRLFSFVFSLYLVLFVVVVVLMTHSQLCQYSVASSSISMLYLHSIVLQQNEFYSVFFAFPDFVRLLINFFQFSAVEDFILKKYIFSCKFFRQFIMNKFVIVFLGLFAVANALAVIDVFENEWLEFTVSLSTIWSVIYSLFCAGNNQKICLFQIFRRNKSESRKSAHSNDYISKNFK